jgi:hypothetical protein
MTLPTLTVYLEAPSTAGTDNGYLVFGDATYDFGTGKFAGPLGNQKNYRTSLRSGSTRRGSTDQTDLLFHANTGNATAAFDNLARTFDPTSNTDIRPGQSYQLIATWSGTPYTLFTGTVDDWNFTYPANAKDAVATMTAVDGIAQIAAANVDERLPQQLSSERVSALLARAAWDPDAVAISTGLTTMPAAERRAVSAWSALTEAADSELGEFYVTAAGVATFRSRTDPVEETRSTTSQATFGPNDLPYHDVQISYGTERVRNDISNDYGADEPALQSDATSIRKYGRRSVSVRTSIVDGAVAKNLNQLYVDIYKNPAIRIDAIVIKPRHTPTTLWPEVLSREIGDRITVELDVPGGGTITRDAWVRGIGHQFDASSQDWTTTYVLQDLSNYRTYITFGDTVFDTDTDHYFFF